MPMNRYKSEALKLYKDSVLLLILVGLVFITTEFKVTLVFGLTFTFSSLFLFLIFRIYGLSLALVTGLAALLFVPRELQLLGLSAIPIIEVLFVGLFFLKGRKAKMFYVDALFWLVLGGFLLFFLNRHNLTDYALYFTISKDIVNGLLNVLLADMLLAYFPFYRLLKSNRLNKNHVSIHQFLSHITLFSILVPFYINVISNTLHTYESLPKELSTEAASIATRMEKALMGLDEEDVFQIQDIVLRNQIQGNEILLESNEGTVVTTDLMTLQHARDLQDQYSLKEMAPHLYEAFPKNNESLQPLNKWSEGQYIYIRSVDSMTILLQYPISQYQNDIFQLSLEQSQYLLLMVLCLVVLLLAFNRMLTNNLKHLTVITTGLPQKLRRLEEIEWPQSSLYELQLLRRNLRKMADKLTELFQESTEMNERLKESEEQLHCLAYYDSLTSLPNRYYFQNYVNELIADPSNKMLAIIFIDLNQFKQINDTLGHDAGDTLLTLTAKKLKVLQNNDREVFRLGGDEFVIVHQLQHKDEVQATLNLIIRELSTYFRIHEQDLYITASIGVSMYPDDGQDLNTLVRFADIAMYISKEMGGNTVQFYDESMRDKFQERLFIENALRAVVDTGGFEQYYQPKTLLGKVTSVEALLRWKDSELGSVSPGVFIPIAEEMGLIFQIDEWSLIQACKQSKQWQIEENIFIPISVNISAKHFQQEYLVSMVKRALDESGLEPRYLKLEITESVFIRNPQHVSYVMEQLKEMGVQISIDDFGKGYSALYQLLHLPIDEIKIDRQFIKNIHENDKQALLVKSILSFAHGLDLNVVAEGVETNYEKEVLMQMGCDEIQGFLFSPPVNKDEFVRLVHAKEPNYL
ncbi:putative bifunctional diguanylate cyclase/phosphodiesterase [Robertmurraya massiliosenegalensis]|uniref:putative bifunctional diguanylate cyclase/phosphodiesterase n=1 Tax=Robertmurraya massiliosenegalensis TaxID=1287657 RepID=UPI00030DE28A|nr:EAL domain-containing protein [Robertmurraya massiliosenegalensis]